MNPTSSYMGHGDAEHRHAGDVYVRNQLLAGQPGQKGDKGDPGLPGSKGDIGPKGDKGDLAYASSYCITNASVPLNSCSCKNGTLSFAPVSFGGFCRTANVTNPCTGGSERSPTTYCVCCVCK